MSGLNIEHRTSNIHLRNVQPSTLNVGRWTFLFLLLSSVLCRPSSVLAQAPLLINYQGRLLSGTNLVNGGVGLSLRLFDASTSGTLHYEDSNTVAVVDGLYSTFLGDQTNSGSFASALTNAQVWVEVAVNGSTLSPRERLASVAFALNVNAAGIAGTIADANISTNIARLNAANQTFAGRVNFSSVSNSFTGTFSGNGAAVTNVRLASIIADQPPVIAWGYNSDGQTTVPASATGVVAIAGGYLHSLALRGDGTVLAWGNNNTGQTNVPATATGVVAIASGYAHSLALRADGTVIAWGDNYSGQTNVPATATGVVAIAAGAEHNLALRANGTVNAWGAGTNDLNDSVHEGQSIVPAAATGVVAIAGGYAHSLALRADGTVIAWGYNGFGQTTVPATATGVVMIAGGYYHSLALRGDGTVVAWGRNNEVQTNVPTTATGVVAIAGGDFYSLALRGDGTVIAWGDNSEGQTNAPASATGVVAIAGGGRHSLALRGARVPAAAVLPRLDAATNAFAGTVCAVAFTGDGSGLTNIGTAALAPDVQTNISARLASNVWAVAASTTNATRRTGDTMSGTLNLPAGGLNVGTTQLVVGSGGAIGVGLAVPVAQLDVRGPSSFIGGVSLGDYNTITSRYIGIINPSQPSNIATGSGFSGVEFGGPAAAGGGVLSGYLAFHTHAFGSGSGEKMRLDKGGNFGIGTNTPGARLHVASGSSGMAPFGGGTVAAFETAANTYVNLLSPYASESGILFGLTNSAVDGGIIYNNGGTLRGLQFRTGGNVTQMAIDPNGNVGVGTTSPTNKLHVVGTVQATAYITGSDVHSKENITPVSAQEILAKVADLPMNTWTFKDDPHSGRHLGPMAQDFRTAFGLGNTDRGIFTVDADGVALASIQALAEEDRRQRTEDRGRQDQINALKRENADLLKRLDELEHELRSIRQERDR